MIKIDIKPLLGKTFEKEKWYCSFFSDRHHGLGHGEQVEQDCIKLLSELDEEEKSFLNGNPDDMALAMEIAAILHDCGRFNDEGEIVASEQKLHQELSAKRAEEFCLKYNLKVILPVVKDAILSHDFQSRQLTPHLKPPTTMIGRIVQSADQIGWFHPLSVYRTLDYNQALGIPFFDQKAELSLRLSWTPGEKSPDALTVMLNQLFGPTGTERFGIKAARRIIEEYKYGLRQNIVKLAGKYRVKKEVTRIIEDFENKFKS